MEYHLPEAFSEFSSARQNGFLKVKSIKEQGGLVAGIICTFTPKEVLDAAGFSAVSLCGMSEETIPFVGIVVPLAVSMGYDAIMGMLVVYVASNVGFSSAFLNPFTVGIAQEMADLPPFSGMGYRIFCSYR